MKRKGGTSGLGFAKPLSIRATDVVAAAVEKERVLMTVKIGTSISASDVMRRAVESYLVEAGHDVVVTPWPSAPNLEDKALDREFVAMVLPP